jgi:hypothetical protein
MLRKALEWASVVLGAPLLGNVEGRFYFRAFEIKRYSKKYVKITSKLLSLSIGAPLGNLEEIRLLGLLEKEKYIWVPFLDTEDIKILSVGPSGTLVKGQGFSKIISDYGGTKGLSIWPSCNGTIRARTHCNQSISQSQHNVYKMEYTLQPKINS